jgi:glutamate racemase
MLTLLHTAESNIAVFEELRKELAPDLEVRHLVADDILRTAQIGGRTEARLTHRVADIYATLGRQFEFVLCTCSTIGAIAEEQSRRYPFPVLRVDRPMAKRAVAQGDRIALLATLPSTIEPTRELLAAEAKVAGRAVQIDEFYCRDAWPLMEAGDATAYANEIARVIDAVAPTHDVVVLAQASMAAAADLRPHCPIPVLSSPRLGFIEAVAQYRAWRDALQSAKQAKRA